MTHHAAFALDNSPFNNFLYAEVGVEENGSGLTMLSLLARLGEDPWAEAARWATLPKADLAAELMAAMARMPLGQQAKAASPATADRLIGLLPAAEAAAPAQTSHLPTWLPMAAFYCAIAAGMMFNGMMVTRNATQAPPVTTTSQPHTPNG